MGGDAGAWQQTDDLLADGHVMVEMLERPATQWPAWMDYCRHVFARAPSPRRRVLERRLLNPDFALHGVPDTARLRRALARVGTLAASVAGAVADGGARELAESLLAESLAADEPIPATLRAGEVRQVRLPVLLVREGRGAVADLQLWCLARRDAPRSGELFAPAPASHLLQPDWRMSLALRRAEALIRMRLGKIGAACNFVLVWDLAPRDGPSGEPGAMLHVQGPSAGASVALAALHLLHDRWAAAEPELAAQLQQIDWERAAVSAALRGRRGALAGVDLAGKIRALVAQDGSGPRLNALFVADDARHLPAGRQSIRIHRCADLDSLVHALAIETNKERLYGLYPDFVAELRHATGQVRDTSPRLVGREWLARRAVDAVTALADSGGVVLLEAPMGWGKTAAALQWVRLRTQSLEPRPAPASADIGTLPLDGWAFVSRGAGSGGSDTGLSGDPETVLRQLDACVRDRLAVPHDAASRSRRGAERVAVLLEVCAAVAAQRGRPVVLLLDGVDEAFDDLNDWLPAAWPRRVVLVLTGRPSGLSSSTLVSRSTRRVHRIELDVQACEQDLQRYIALCAQDIVRRHGAAAGRLLGAAQQQAMRVACQGLFVVASRMLRERAELLADLAAWLKNPRSLPQGAAEIFDLELDHVQQRAATRLPGVWQGDAKLLTLNTLAWIATSQAAWAKEQLLELLDVLPALAETGADLRRAWRAFTDGVGAERELSWQVQHVIRHCGDLFGISVVEPASLLVFANDGLREAVLRRRQTLVVHLHRLWAGLCEACLDADPRLPRDAAIERYALRHGVWHLASAGDWLRAADRLLGFGADPRAAWLERMFESVDAAQRDQAWPTLLSLISAVLESAGPTQSDPAQAERLLLLRCLRHVLADQHTLIARGELPLAIALYNRLAGRWRAGSPWGERLRQAADAVAQPCLRCVDPAPGLAVAGMLHRVDSAATCIASSDDGSVVAVGLADGQTLLWTLDELVYGRAGRRVTRHASAVSAVAVMASAADGGWLLVSGSHDGSARIAAANDLRRPEWDADRPGLLGRVATQHSGWVNAVAIVPCEREGGWLLASASNDGSTRIASARELDPAATGAAQPPATVATRHADAVLCVALVASERLGWVLASGACDGTSQVVCADEVHHARPVEPDAVPAGRIATRHPDWVQCVALMASEQEGGWLLASGGRDGTTRVARAVDPGGATGVGSRHPPSGRVATQHAQGVCALSLARCEREGGWLLASGSIDGTVRMSGANDEHEAGDSAGSDVWRHKDRVRSLVLRCDDLQGGWLLACGSHDHTACVIGGSQRTGTDRASGFTAAGRPLSVRHSGWVLSVALVPAARYGGWVLASASADGSVRIATAQESDPLVSVSIDADAARMGRLAARHESNVVCLALCASPDSGGWLLASGCTDGSTRVVCADDLQQPAWREAGGALGRLATRHDARLSALAIGPTHESGGWVVASGADDGSTRVATSGEVANTGSAAPCLGRLATRHEGQVNTVGVVACRGEGGWIVASGGSDGRTCIAGANDLARAGWGRARSGSVGRLVKRQACGVVAVALIGEPGAGSWRLASGGSDGRVHVCSGTEPAEHSLELSGHEAALRRMVVADAGPNGCWLAAMGDDARVRVAALHDPAGAPPSGPTTCHLHAAARCIALGAGPRGPVLAVADPVVRLIAVGDAARPGPAQPVAHPVDAMLWLEDQRRLLLAWAVGPEVLVEEFEVCHWP